MGFWSTVLTALSFRADRLPVVTRPMIVHRLELDASLTRLRVDTKNVYRMQNNSDVA